MATGAQAVERIAQATDLLPATVFRFARTLREADKTLWPEAAKGGGKGAAHVEPPHLVNLAIALAVNDPRDAVRAIPVYRRLMPDKPEQHILDDRDVGIAASLLRTNDAFNGKRALGAELDRLLALLLEGDTAVVLGSAGLHVEFYIEHRVPRARVRFHAFDLEDDLRHHLADLLYRRPKTPQGLSRALDPYFNFLPPRLITRTALLPVSLFAVLAELWADTKQHHANSARRQGRRPALIKE
jgi:hypothetical protein